MSIHQVVPGTPSFSAAELYRQRSWSEVARASFRQAATTTGWTGNKRIEEEANRYVDLPARQAFGTTYTSAVTTTYGGDIDAFNAAVTTYNQNNPGEHVPTYDEYESIRLRVANRYQREAALASQYSDSSTATTWLGEVVGRYGGAFTTPEGAALAGVSAVAGTLTAGAGGGLVAGLAVDAGVTFTGEVALGYAGSGWRERNLGQAVTLGEVASDALVATLIDTGINTAIVGTAVGATAAAKGIVKSSRRLQILRASAALRAAQVDASEIVVPTETSLDINAQFEPQAEGATLPDIYNPQAEGATLPDIYNPQMAAEPERVMDTLIQRVTSGMPLLDAQSKEALDPLIRQFMAGDLEESSLGDKLVPLLVNDARRRIAAGLVEAKATSDRQVTALVGDYLNSQAQGAVDADVAADFASKTDITLRRKTVAKELTAAKAARKAAMGRLKRAVKIIGARSDTADALQLRLARLEDELRQATARYAKAFAEKYNIDRLAKALDAIANNNRAALPAQMRAAGDLAEALESARYELAAKIGISPEVYKTLTDTYYGLSGADLTKALIGDILVAGDINRTTLRQEALARAGVDVAELQNLLEGAYGREGPITARDAEALYLKGYTRKDLAKRSQEIEEVLTLYQEASDVDMAARGKIDYNLSAAMKLPILEAEQVKVHSQLAALDRFIKATTTLDGIRADLNKGDIDAVTQALPQVPAMVRELAMAKEKMANLAASKAMGATTEAQRAQAHEAYVENVEADTVNTTATTEPDPEAVEVELNVYQEAYAEWESMQDPEALAEAKAAVKAMGYDPADGVEQADAKSLAEAAAALRVCRKGGDANG